MLQRYLPKTQRTIELIVSEWCLTLYRDVQILAPISIYILTDIFQNTELFTVDYIYITLIDLFPYSTQLICNIKKS